MRRLPIYFLIDVSESMVGEPIQIVEEGMATIIKELRSDPYALETVWVSIIVFAGQPKTLTPLQEVITFYPPKFPIGSGTSLGDGLGHLMFELNKNIVKTTADTKGDWKPIIFLFTDGTATDDTRAAIAEWKSKWRTGANMVAVSLGDDNNLAMLKELTENVLLMKDTSPDKLKSFFKWVTASIKTSSISVEKNSTGFELALLDKNVVEKVPDNVAPINTANLDPNFVVLSAKCQNTHKSYLVKYKLHTSPLEIGGMSMSSRHYRLQGAYNIANDYYELADNNAGFAGKINTEELMGFPACPSCGNQFGVAVCQCQKIHCCGNEEISTCPWCGNKAQYGSGEGGMDLNRQLG